MKQVYLHIEYDKWVYGYLRSAFKRNHASLKTLGFTHASSSDSNSGESITDWLEHRASEDSSLILSIDATGHSPVNATTVLADAINAVTAFRSSDTSADIDLSAIALLSDPIALLSRGYLAGLDTLAPVNNAAKDNPTEGKFSEFLERRAPTILTQYLAQTSTLLQAYERSETPYRVFNLSRLPNHRDSTLISTVFELKSSDLTQAPVKQGREQFTALELGVAASLQNGLAKTDNDGVQQYLKRLLIDRFEVQRDASSQFCASSRHPAVKHFLAAHENQINDFNASIPSAQRLQTQPGIGPADADAINEHPVDQAGLAHEAFQLDAFYGRLIGDAVIRNILEVLANNLSVDGKINALRVICEDLPPVYPRVDLKFWNAYARALREVSRIKANPAIQKATALRQQVHSNSGDSGTNVDDANASTDAITVKISTNYRSGRGRTEPDQKKIFLHVGHTKTGSSYIQSVLARNQQRLRDNGIYYPLTEKDLEQAERGNVTCGNRSVIDDDEALQRAFSVDASLLLSNESMWKRFSDPAFVETLAAAAQRTKRPVAVFMCIRDPIAHNRSRYMQLSQTGIIDMSLAEFFTTKAVRDQRSRFRHIERLMEVCNENDFELTLLDYTDIRPKLLDVFCNFLELADDLELKVPQSKVNRSMGAIELGVRRALNTLHSDQPNLPRDRNYLRDLIDKTPQLPFSLPTPDPGAVTQFAREIENDIERMNALLPDGLKYHCEVEQPIADDAVDTYANFDSEYGRALVEAIALFTLDIVYKQCNDADRASVTEIKTRFLSQTSAPEHYASLVADLDQRVSMATPGWRQRIGRLQKRLGFG